MPYTAKGVGYRKPGTSYDAAEAVDAAMWCGLALQTLHQRELTADEVANYLGASVLTIRPRITDLLKMGLIEDTGERRKNASGRNAAVWRRVPPSKHNDNDQKKG